MIQGRAYQKYLAPLFVLALAGLVYATAGFHNRLARDDAFDIYSAQQILRGVPHYVSVFVAKGPLAPMLLALSLVVGRAFGISDVMTARLQACLIGCVLALTMYVLAAHLLASRRAGFIAVLLLLVSQPLTFYVTSGPAPKLPMLPAMLLNLYLTARRRWFWAGLTGALAALVWQPMAVFPLITLCLALLQARAGRRRADAAALAGMALPALIIFAYFAERKALGALADGMVIFNLFYIDRGDVSLLERLLKPLSRVFQYYSGLLVPMCAALAAFAGLYATAWRHRSSLRAFLTEDPWAPVLLSLPAPVLWSAVDFQNYPDFYVFLPYIALGAALAVEKGLRWIEHQDRGRRRAQAAALGLCLALLGAAIWTNQTLRWANEGLDPQVGATTQIVKRFGPEARVLAINAPQVYVLSRGVSPTRFLAPMAVYEPFMEAREPAGYAGWLERLRQYDPQAVVVGPLNGRHEPDLLGWLQAGFKRERIWPWAMYVKRQ
jgi:hypothetical protein